MSVDERGQFIRELELKKEELDLSAMKDEKSIGTQKSEEKTDFVSI